MRYLKVLNKLNTYSAKGKGQDGQYLYRTEQAMMVSGV
jgi:hypothetical protein